MLHFIPALYCGGAFLYMLCYYCKVHYPLAQREVKKRDDGASCNWRPLYSRVVLVDHEPP